MEDNVKINNYKRFIVSKDNIIIEVNKKFLGLMGYAESEILGLTLVEASKLFRTDSQVDLQEIEGDIRVFIFTKELAAIEGTISCKSIDSGVQMFSFKVDPLNLANKSFDLPSQLGTSRGDALAIYNFDNLILINCNQNYLDILEPPYNIRSNSIGMMILT